MHAEVFRWLSSPIRLWRTILLVFGAALIVAKLSGDGLAVLCTTTACAFLLIGFERREWIEMPLDRQAGDLLARLSLAFVAALVV